MTEKMTKSQYIENNKYLRKWFSNLTDEDKEFFVLIWQWKINPTSKDSVLRFKQVVYHMQKWMNLWECRWLLKAFKTLQKLPD